MSKRALAAAGFFSLVSVVSASAGCAHPEEAHAVSPARPRASYPLPDGAAQVCVVRPDSVARDVSMPVRDNGRLVGATRGATYFCWIAATGEHQITSRDDDTGPTLLEARPGGLYYLHQEVTELAGTVHAHLDFVDDAAAAELIEGCEERVRVAVPGHEDEPAAMRIAPAKARRAR